MQQAGAGLDRGRKAMPAASGWAQILWFSKFSFAGGKGKVHKRMRPGRSVAHRQR